MNFTQLFTVLRARRLIVLFTLFMTVATTLVVSLLLPKTYKATTTLILNYKGIDAVSGVVLPAQLTGGYMATQIDIINSKNVVLKVVDALKLADGNAVKRDFYESTGGQGDIREWLAELLLKNLDVTPSRESSVLAVTFKGSDPQFAAAVANAVAAEYQQTAVQLKVDPLKKASTYFNSQIKVLRENLETAQNKVSKYQQEKGIVSMDNRLDVETARLNDLSSQLVLVQTQLMEAASRRRQATGENGGESPDVLANPLVQNLKASLAQMEAKFSDISQKLGQNHPLYQGMKAEIEQLRAELNRNIQSTSNGVGNNALILHRRESELRSALQAQKAKVLELNRARDELAVLGKEVENAQRAYELTTQRFTQTRLEGQADQVDVAVLDPAVPPLEPANPKVLLNILLSVFLGTVLGLSFGLLAEMLDRRVRTADDLVEGLQMPVLGAVHRALPKGRRFAFPKLFVPRRLRLN